MRELAEDVVGEGLFRRAVGKADSCEKALRRVPCIGSDDAARVRFRGKAVVGIVGPDGSPAVGVSFFQFQPGSVMVSPDGSVSAGKIGWVGNDRFFVYAEGGEADKAVCVIPGEQGRLDGRAVFRCFTVPDIVGIVGRIAQGICDGRGIVAGRAIGRGCRIAGSISYGNRAAGNVRMSGGSVPPAIRDRPDEAGFRVTAGEGGDDSPIIRF